MSIRWSPSSAMRRSSRNFFYLDGAISVTQPFLTPFGAQPTDLSSGTQNRYTASSYRVTPYIQGVLPGNVEYELRNNSIWANENGAPISTNNSFTNEWLGHLASPLAPLGWFADLDAVDVKFSNQSSQRMNQVRAGPRYAYDAQIRLQASVGYEDNNFPLTNYRGYTYGAGIEWRPSDRTTAFANVEHRFFGTSYLGHPRSPDALDGVEFQRFEKHHELPAAAGDALANFVHERRWPAEPIVRVANSRARRCARTPSTAISQARGCRHR